MKQRILWTLTGVVVGILAVLAALFVFDPGDTEAACKPGDPAPCPGPDGRPVLLTSLGQSQLLAQYGGPVKIHLALTHAEGSDPFQFSRGLLTVVQWQDNENNWHDVTGWQQMLPTHGGGVDWYVAAKDFGTGPFRWRVHDVANARDVAYTNPFMIPRQGEAIAIIYKLGLANRPAPIAVQPTRAPASAPAPVGRGGVAATPRPQSPVLQNGAQVVVQSRGLNLRALPSSYSRIYTVLPQGLVLDVLSTAPNRQWYQVRLGDVTGWVYSPLTRPR